MIDLPNEWRAEHLRVDFGRRKPPRKRTNYAALALLATFAVSLTAGLHVENEGLAVLLVVIAFGALLAGMAAAYDA